jgi:type III secretory pathway component EscU
MSLDELKREHREDCGDPQTKAQRQALHRSMSYEEIVRRTRRSKVIIVEASGTEGE